MKNIWHDLILCYKNAESNFRSIFGADLMNETQWVLLFASVRNENVDYKFSGAPETQTHAHMHLVLRKINVFSRK